MGFRGFGFGVHGLRFRELQKLFPSFCSRTEDAK